MSVVGDVAALVRARYVFPEAGERAAQELLTREAAGRYEGLDEEPLSERLTADLFELCRDHHLRVRPRSTDGGAEQDQDALWRALLRRTNFGIERVARLEGNVGLLDLRLVTDPGPGGRAVAAAMELVANTHALILDLRGNRGGSPQGVAMWCSYLFADDQTHLNDIYDGESGATRQFWTWGWVPGERYLDRPVWVLTSEQTFSGGEELAYNLKVLGRATLVGATTRGGAHPTTVVPISPTLEVTVPAARSVNPVTGTNWEGTGVEPHVRVDPGEALAFAHAEAARHVLGAVPGSPEAQEAAAVLASGPGDAGTPVD